MIPGQEGESTPQGPGRRVSGRGVLLGVAKLVATVLVTWFIFRRLGVSFDEVRALDVEDFRPSAVPILAGTAILLVGHVYAGWMWARMARDFGAPPVPPLRAFAVFMAANLGRYVPGKFWQILGLAYLARGESMSAGAATASAILGHIFALGAAAALAVPVLWGVGGGSEWAILAAAAGAYVLAMTLAAGLTPRRVLERALARAPRAQQALTVIDAGFGFRWSLRFLLGWGLYVFAFGLFVAAFRPGLSLVLTMSSFAAAYFIGYVMIFAPAGVGVREGALSGFLEPFVGVGAAVALAVVARLWTTLAELVPAALLAPGAIRRAERAGPGGTTGADESATGSSASPGTQGSD